MKEQLRTNQGPPRAQEENTGRRKLCLIMEQKPEDPLQHLLHLLHPVFSSDASLDCPSQ